LQEQLNILLYKLDVFIRKYYKNQVIKGGIFFLSLFLIFFLLVNLLEYYGHFNITTRTFIFFIYLALNFAVFIFYILIPVFKLFRIGKILTKKQAAEIIGNHFKEVEDKLLNTLQLSELSNHSAVNFELINASIDQKIMDLKPIPFNAAIDLSKNRKYVKYVLPPLFILIIILFSSPTLITGPTKRLVQFNEPFEKKLLYTIVITNDKLEVVQNEDFRLEVKVAGEEIPEDIFLETKDSKIKLVKENKINFSYTFINVQKSLKFKLFSESFYSTEYELAVLPKPILLDFEITLSYPSYTGKKEEIIKNNGDIILPLGTIVNWNFYTRNTENMIMRFKDRTISPDRKSPDIFSYKDVLYESQSYTISISNNLLKNSDSLTYAISVIPDLYPSILVDEFRDSVYEKQVYFKGSIKDDYGFDLLTFNYSKDTESATKSQNIIDTLPISIGTNPQQFFHYFDLSSIGLEAGGKVEYFFEVWDNDRINGSKSSKSQLMTYKVPSLEEIDKQTSESNETIKNEMEEAIKEVQKLQKEIEDLNKKMVDKKELSWEDKNQIKSLLEKQKDLQERLESIKNENEQKALNEREYKEMDEELVEKQKQLEELFEKLMQDEELNQLFKELQELLDQVDKDKVNELLEKMKMSNEEMEKMLDRNLEIFKQLEFESKLEETINKLNDLSEKQEQLSEETLDKENEHEELNQQQKNINQEFDKVKKDIKDLDKMNKELEEPNSFDKMEDQQQNIDNDLQESENSLNKNQRNKASNSQKNASQKMQKMSESLTTMQQEMVQEGMEEDIDALRDILENLIQLSFDQEDLIGKVNSVNINDPKYTDLIREQKNIKDDLKLVEDSLFALSKRQIMIEPFISKEISSINQNIEKSIEHLNNRRSNQSAEKQQYVMTSINNLALMLSETLNQMMQSMMQSSSCKSSCKSGKPKPGEGQSSLKSMRQLQEQLNKQIESLKAGKKEGGKDPNGKSGNQSKSMSEQLARMAAQQEAVRNQMQQYSDQLEKEGNFGASKEFKKMMNDMEKTETELVNKIITQETLLRQQEILTRLLNSEKAELEREKEEKRESNEAKNQINRNPDEIIKYNGQQSNEVELLKTMPPALKQFYKSKVNQYFYNFEELLEK
jgi:hypothetical protein